MERKTVVFTVVVSVVFEGDRPWQKNVRIVRKELKERIGSYPDMKVLSIDTKEG